MTDQHEHHEPEQANPKDKSLEAQLDALLEDLEAVEPEMVPKDLRRHPPQPAQPGPAANPPVEPDARPAAEAEPDVTPAAEAEPEPAIAASRGAAQPGRKGLDLESIASMASNLLDQQIDATIAAAQQTAPRLTEPQPTETQAGPSAAEPRPAGKVLNEVELGDQIQALLNQVQAQPASAEAETRRASGAAGAEAPAEPTPVPAQAAAEPVERDTDASFDPGAVSIEQIDAMLAESAEQAIEREPEPVSEVPGTDEILAAQARAEDEQARARQARWEPAPAPQPVVEEPRPVSAAGASARDVARELEKDEIPEPVAVTPEPLPPHAAPRSGPASETEAFEPDAIVIHRSALKQAERRLLRLCGTINRPLNRLSPEMKDTVGYVGIVVLLPALCLILYGLLF